MVHESSPKIDPGEPLQGRADVAEKRIKRHWYPSVLSGHRSLGSVTNQASVLLFVIALNVFLIASTFYLIYNADVSMDRCAGVLQTLILLFSYIAPTKDPT